jgi:hypothetical protein
MPRALQALRPKRSPCGRRRERGGCANQHPPALVLQFGLQIVRNPAAKTRNHRRTRLKDSTTRRGTGMSGQHNLLPRPPSIVANRRKGAAALRQRGRYRVACQTPVQSCEGETVGWLNQRRCATEERRARGTEDCGRDARQTQQRARDITFGFFVAMAMATICTRTLRDVG